MSGPADLGSLALALTERLGASPGKPSGSLLSLAYKNGQRSEATLRSDGGAIVLTAPVAGSHHRLPRPVLARLLAANIFGGPLAGGVLRVRHGADMLEIANVVPAELGPEMLANLMINQARAASVLAAGLASETTETTESHLGQGER